MTRKRKDCLPFIVILAHIAVFAILIWGITAP